MTAAGLIGAALDALDLLPKEALLHLVLAAWFYEAATRHRTYKRWFLRGVCAYYLFVFTKGVHSDTSNVFILIMVASAIVLVDAIKKWTNAT